MKILEDAVDHARRQLEYTTDATAFCDTEFTIAELRRVYEIVWQTKTTAGPPRSSLRGRSSGCRCHRAR
ncbi:hypothetical protein O1R50_05490 [Glycomyces luteolus]|uniref:Uncharacterized protein n=1 Tax=Glycomyces luteolus TaxID=2670330 RepID=A0A9X3T2R0_9ACTN|nr:hypothetical protein [Glycomyces luteolus]MDA1359065.1 hypothetical protein [Glycomyces luteolus]